MAQKGPKRQKDPIFLTRQILKIKRKEWVLLNLILFSGWKDIACDTHANKKLKNIENNLKMPYLHYISTTLDSKSVQIKALDVTFQMHSTAIFFDMVKYLKN